MAGWRVNVTIPSLWSKQQLAKQQSQSWGQCVPWVREQQAALFDFALLQGLPDRHVEAWKYTSVVALPQETYEVATTSPTLDISSYRIADTYCLAFVDGKWRADLSDCDALPKTVRCFSMADMVQQSSTELEIWWQSINWKISTFTALNAALATDGIVIDIAPQVQLQKALHILYIHTQQKT